MKISACVITKNEEKNLPTCLESLKSIVSEMIVVDTGSTDRTVDIAESYGAKVFSFKWINDFAAARNYAIEQTKSDWIIFLDADEYIAPECVKYVPGAIMEAEQKKLDMVICTMVNVEKKTNKMISSNLHIRIFRNHPSIRYIGAVHERIVKLDSSANALDVQKDITILHTGYSEENIITKEKSKRNLELLFEELQRKPDSFDLMFYISEAYMLDRKFEQALEFAKRAQQYQNSELKGIYEKNYVNIFQCLLHLERTKDEILSTIKEAIVKYPMYPDFHLYLGDFYKKENRYRDAITAYQEGINLLGDTSVAQTSGIATAVKVIDTIAQLYSKLREWNSCVHYHVKAIQIDKYLYSSLQNLMSVLGQFEKPEKILSFFGKLYDLRSVKDRLYLLRAALDTNNTDIAQELLGALPIEHEALHGYNALKQFLDGNYESAYSLFLKLYQQSLKEEHAYGIIASVWRGKKKQTATELNELFNNRPMLRQLTMDIFGTNSPISINNKKNVYEFLIYMSGTLHVTDHHVLKNLVQRADLLLEMGNYLYYREKYADAYLFFNQYLEHSGEIQTQLLPELTYKVGDCLMKSDQDEQAWLFLRKAHSLAPDDYRVYELLIEKGKQFGLVDEVKSICQTAIQYYPDSIYLQKVFQEYA